MVRMIVPVSVPTIIQKYLFETLVSDIFGLVFTVYKPFLIYLISKFDSFINV